MIFECVLEKKKNRWAPRGSDGKKKRIYVDKWLMEKKFLDTLSII